MRFKSSIFAFFHGVEVASLATSVLFYQWHRRQELLLWTSFLDQHLRTVRALQAGELEAVQADLNARLPALIQSVNSFGAESSSAPVLERASEYLRSHGDSPLPQAHQPR